MEGKTFKEIVSCTFKTSISPKPSTGSTVIAVFDRSLEKYQEPILLLTYTRIASIFAPVQGLRYNTILFRNNFFKSKVFFRLKSIIKISKMTSR